MADANTIARIGGLLKNVYGPGIREQQNMASLTRKRFSKAKGVRMGGDHLELAVRMGGNRAGVGARLSDDPLPVAGLQQVKKASVYDRAVFGVIKVYDKDVQNARTDQQSFINHLDDEVSGVTRDVLKVMNIDTFMDGTGILTTVNANTVASNQFVGKVGTAFGDFGTRYLQVGDVLDVWDPTFVTQRTGAGGVTVTAIEPSTQTVTVSANLTLTAGDIVVRVLTANKNYIGLQMATDSSSGVTFENVSRATYPQWRGNVVAAGGAALSEALIQELLSAIDVSSGEEPTAFIGGNAQWDGYIALGQSLKRYTEMKLDRGFSELTYQGISFVKDTDCLPMSVFAINDEHCQNGVVTPLDWSEEDGHMLKWNSGYAAYTAFMREYGNYVYDRPNSLGRIEALQVPASYVR